MPSYCASHELKVVPDTIYLVRPVERHAALTPVDPNIKLTKAGVPLPFFEGGSIDCTVCHEYQDELGSGCDVKHFTGTVRAAYRSDDGQLYFLVNLPGDHPKWPHTILLRKDDLLRLTGKLRHDDREFDAYIFWQNRDSNGEPSGTPSFHHRTQI